MSSDKAETTHKEETWRELLGNSIKSPQERQRIARELNINPMTLTRWVNRETDPHPQNLRRLLHALPQYRQRLITLIEQEFPGLFEATPDEEEHQVPATIPSEFYKRALYTHAYTPKSLLFSRLGDLILQQALDQLDPHRQGLAIMVACCMPPSLGQKIRSLRERLGRGTPPWSRYLEMQAILLGAESLAGHAISSGHLLVNQNLRDEHSIAPGYRGPWEVSAAAIPIISKGKIGGSLLAVSTQPDYFLSTRCQLIESYDELIALIFAPEDLYEYHQIELAILPRYEEQQPYLSKFQQQLIDLMKQSGGTQQPRTVSEAEQLIWLQIETELLHASLVEPHQEEP